MEKGIHEGGTKVPKITLPRVGLSHNFHL